MPSRTVRDGFFSESLVVSITDKPELPGNSARNPIRVWNRILWYSRYDDENLILIMKFCAGEKHDLVNEKSVVPEYSGMMAFKLIK